MIIRLKYGRRRWGNSRISEFRISSRGVARGELRSENDCTIGTHASVLKVASKSLSMHHVSMVDMD